MRSVKLRRHAIAIERRPLRGQAASPRNCYREETATRSSCVATPISIERRPLRGQAASPRQLLSEGDRYAVKLRRHANCYREETATRSRP